VTGKQFTRRLRVVYPQRRIVVIRERNLPLGFVVMPQIFGHTARLGTLEIARQPDDVVDNAQRPTGIICHHPSEL